MLLSHSLVRRVIPDGATRAPCCCSTVQLSTSSQRAKGDAATKAVGLEEETSNSWGSNLRGLGHNNYLGKILNARVYEAANETPLQRAPSLSAQLKNTIHLKREDLQPVFSFKIRGAYNKIAQLSREQLRAGIVACSAGNHAQGVAMSADMLGVDAGKRNGPDPDSLGRIHHGPSTLLPERLLLLRADATFPTPSRSQ